jgi:hypothetical protein
MNPCFRCWKRRGSGRGGFCGGLAAPKRHHRLSTSGKCRRRSGAEAVLSSLRGIHVSRNPRSPTHLPGLCRGFLLFFPRCAPQPWPPALLPSPNSFFTRHSPLPLASGAGAGGIEELTGAFVEPPQGPAPRSGGSSAPPLRSAPRDSARPDLASSIQSPGNPGAPSRLSAASIRLGSSPFAPHTSPARCSGSSSHPRLAPLH